MQDDRRKAGIICAASAALLALAVPLAGPAIAAAEAPGPGKLLVATEDVRGPFFRETVVLLLHYDREGALGLVINRPMRATPQEVMPDAGGVEDYEGTLYWGGPVQVSSLRALMRTDDPPAEAVHIVDAVYLVAFDGAIPPGKGDTSALRFFLGYAGWGRGQLEAELRAKSWRVVPATGDLVFSDDTAGIWRTLMPPSTIRARAPQGPDSDPGPGTARQRTVAARF